MAVGLYRKCGVRSYGVTRVLADSSLIHSLAHLLLRLDKEVALKRGVARTSLEATGNSRGAEGSSI
jgi:hypothetical protein